MNVDFDALGEGRLQYPAEVNLVPTAEVRIENLVDALVQAGADIRVKCYDYKPELWRNGMYQLTHDLTSACNVKKIVSVHLDGVQVINTLRRCVLKLH